MREEMEETSLKRSFPQTPFKKIQRRIWLAPNPLKFLTFCITNTEIDKYINFSIIYLICILERNIYSFSQ